MRKAGSRPPGLQLPEEPPGGRRRRAVVAILKSDLPSPRLCVSGGRPLGCREPGRLAERGRRRGRGRRRARQLWETRRGPSAACAAVTQHPLEASPRPPPARGAGLSTLVPRAGARVAEARPCGARTSGLCHAGGRPPRREAERSPGLVSDPPAAVVAGKLGTR